MGMALLRERKAFHRRHRSRAASRQPGNRNLKPSSSSRRGTTRRLFRTSSVSVRMKIAPSSSIQRGREAHGMPDASRSARMNAAFGSGWRRKVHGASIVLGSISQRTAATKSWS